MKKLFTIAIFMSLFLPTHAQTGTVLLGGDVSFNTTKQDFGNNGDYKIQSLVFYPYVGYQFNNNWTAGIVSGIANYKQKQVSYETKNSEFNLGPFVRYTKTVTDLFYLYGQLEGRFGSRKTKQNGITEQELNSTTLNLFPAVFLNLKNSFGLNFNLGGITYITSKANDRNTSSSFNFNFGRAASIGVSKNFGTSKK